MWRLWGLCKVRGKPENWHSSPGLLLQPERPSLLPRAPSVLLSRRILLSLWLSLRYTPPPPHPTPPDSLALRSAAGHVPDPVREVTWGPVFGGPLHLLVPVCAVCHRAFPLQDPAGLQSGETQQHVCVVTSKLFFFSLRLFICSSASCLPWCGSLWRSSWPVSSSLRPSLVAMALQLVGVLFPHTSQAIGRQRLVLLVPMSRHR